MSDLNPFVSSGTCYFAPGERSDAVFIPCGNAGLGHVTCCQAGDICLSSRACYNQRFGVTYLAVCSDSGYEDKSCPDKGRLENHPWAGLVYCNGTSHEWSACRQSRLPKTLTVADDCYCPETSRSVAFSASAVLDNVASLPLSSGGSLVWQTGYAPTLPIQAEESHASAGSSEVPDRTGEKILPSASDVVEVFYEEDGEAEAGVSAGAKVGIGVAVSVVGVLVFAAMVLLLLRRKVAIKAARMDDDSPPFNAGPLTTTSTPSELESKAAGPWSLRPELAGATPTCHRGSERRGPDLRYSSMPQEMQCAAVIPGRAVAVELPG